MGFIHIYISNILYIYIYIGLIAVIYIYVYIDVFIYRAYIGFIGFTTESGLIFTRDLG